MIDSEPGCVRAETENAVPVRRWQRLQWQYAAPSRGSETSNFTVPHMQAPVRGALPWGAGVGTSGASLTRRAYPVELRAC